MTAPLRRVLVRPPTEDACRHWREFGWRSAPDPARLVAEHEAFCELLEATAAEIFSATPSEENPDAIYPFDPAIATEDGAILLRPGKEGRRAEPDVVATDLARAGVPIKGALEAPALAEGGDLIRLDECTLLAGCGYRTSLDGIAAVRGLLPGVETLTFDLPTWHGEGEVMHLLSLLSPLDTDLVVAYTPLLPVRLTELLHHRGVEIVPVPPEEFETMGTNVLALAPRVGLLLDRNRDTRKRLERAGVEVLVYCGDELSLKGNGGPTCLTMPLWRA